MIVSGFLFCLGVLACLWCLANAELLWDLLLVVGYLCLWLVGVTIGCVVIGMIGYEMWTAHPNDVLAVAIVAIIGAIAWGAWQGIRYCWQHRHDPKPSHMDWLKERDQ